MSKLIKQVALSDIKPYPNNPRKNDEAVDKVAESIKEFGFLVPVLLDPNKVIVAGHTRYKAAKQLGLEKVPCIVLEGLSEEDIQQYRIVDNKISELSSWDYERLAKELEGIHELNMKAFGINFESDDEEAVVEFEQNIENKELDLSDFDDEAFENECPWCGFRW